MATFQNRARAAQALKEFRDAGYRAYDVEVSLPGGERAFAVLLGLYADIETATQDLVRARQIPGYGSGRIIQADRSAPPVISQP
jgi:cell division septation protein DedD